MDTGVENILSLEHYKLLFALKDNRLHWKEAKQEEKKISIWIRVNRNKAMSSTSTKILSFTPPADAQEMQEKE